MDIAIHKFKPYLANIGGEDARQRLDPGLLEAEDRVPKDVENGDGNGKPAQSSQAIGSVCSHLQNHKFLLPAEASMIVCKPGVRCKVWRWMVPFTSRQERSTAMVADLAS